MAQTSYQSHISLLELAVALFPQCNAFKIPVYDEHGKLAGWDDVTYKQFYNDVRNMAAHWIKTLGLPRKSVVAVWLYGVSYRDMVTIFSIFMAGYLPQNIRLTLESPALVSEMLSETNAGALIYDSSCGIAPTHFLVPSYWAVDVKSLQGAPNMEILPSLADTGNGDEIIMFYYTSGSTSGRPKLVPVRRKLLHAIVLKSTHRTPVGPVRPVTTRIGSLSHAAQLHQFLYLFPFGGCVVLVDTSFSSGDFVHMVEHGGLTTASILPYHLTKLLKEARNDPRLLSGLQSMHQITCTGGPVPKDDLDWACSNGLHIVATFGMTEAGQLLHSVNKRGGKSSPHNKIELEGFHHTFFPVKGASSLSGEDLLELVVLSESLDCPDVSLRSPDGHFHTGDTFVEVSPKCYDYRGRLDDRIKMYCNLLCDARAIEEYTISHCSDVITDCIVVGAGRLTPTLIVEAHSHKLYETKIKEEVSLRITFLNKRLYQHERIESGHIFVVGSGTLPRTGKGSIRRRAVEEQFKTQLDVLENQTSNGSPNVSQSVVTSGNRVA